MTKILFTADLLIVGVTIALTYLPVTRKELPLWRCLRINRIRRRITERRRVQEPLDRDTTPRIARLNLRWHLLLTSLFTYQIGMIASHGSPLLQLLAFPLTLFCVAYLVGSLVQRQKFAIVTCRFKAH